MNHRFLTKKILYPTNIIFILIILTANVWAFETNSDSKITGSLDVTGSLKLGSVDSSSSGIVTFVADNSNSTIPTTGAVKAYVDAQAAGSSGGYPTEVGYWVDGGQFPLTYCKNKGAGWRIPSLNEAVNLVTTSQTQRYFWTTDLGFGPNEYIVVRVSDGSFGSVVATNTMAPDEYAVNYVCVK